MDKRTGRPASRSSNTISLRSRKSREAAARRRERQAVRAAKLRRRPRRDPNPGLRRFALCAFVVEMAVLLFANPFLRVTTVRVDGAQTLLPQQVFDEAQVPAHTNIFWMALRERFGPRLASADPVVDHAGQRILLPHTLVLTVQERQPVVTLQTANAFYLMDKDGVPYRVVDFAPAALPRIAWKNNAPPALGRPLVQAWLPPACTLLTLLPQAIPSAPPEITVDQNANICLNRDGVRVYLGQPDALPQKVALVQTALTADRGEIARRAAYVDVSSPQHPVWMPRPALQAEDKKRVRPAVYRVPQEASPNEQAQ